MKSLPKTLKNVLATILFFISFTTMASDLPDPEVLAKQYLKDLCTLNEQDFTRKYMLTQIDVEELIKNLNKANTDINDELSEKLSDSLVLRGEVHSLVVKSYRAFKEWQHENNIDSSKIKYHSFEFEMEKRRKMPFYALDDMNIYFSYDTVNYVFSCDDFLYLKTKWIGGDFDGVEKVDKYFNTIYNEYDYAVDSVAVAVDTAYAYDYAETEYSEYATEAPEEVILSKKQLKIQKKIDAYNRKIDALYTKQYE